MSIESIGPSPAYMQAQQAAVNLASPPSLYPAAFTTSATTVYSQTIHIRSQDPFITPIICTLQPGIFTAVLDRGATARKAARISREKIWLKVAKVLDKILSDVKKNCSESAELLEKVILTVIEGLAAALPLNISQPTYKLHQFPKLSNKSLPFEQISKIKYVGILRRGSNTFKKPKKGMLSIP